MSGVDGSSSPVATPGPSARPRRSPPAEIAPGVPQCNQRVQRLFRADSSGVRIQLGPLTLNPPQG